MKKALKLLALVAILGISITSCQKDVATDQDLPIAHEMGMLFLPAADYAKIQVATNPANIDLKALPTSVNLIMPVGNQGGEGSCVAWGTTYAGRSLTYNTSLTGWSQSVNIFSPEYVYNQIKASSSCGSGSYVKTGLDLLKSQGSCTWASMPYTDVSCSTLPNAAQTAEAANYKISSYATVPITVNALKTQLAAGQPVVVGGQVNKAYQYLASGVVLGSFKKPSLGGHCYCVVGYDDTKGAFKFQNSWGTTWASAGYGWIGYNYITQWWSEAYVMSN